MSEHNFPDAAMPAGGVARPRTWNVLIRMLLVQIAATSSILGLTALAPDASQTLGVGAHWIGYQVSFIYFAGLFASLGAGSLTARWSAGRIISAELALILAGLALLVSAVPVAMVVGSVLLGLAYGINNPASSEILQGVVTARNRSLVFSLKQAGVPLGAMLASAGLPIVAEMTGGWAPALLSLMALPLALLLLPMGRTPDLGRKRVRGSGVLARMLTEQRRIFVDPALRTLAALGCLYSAMQLTVTAFAVVSLVEIGWSVPQAGLAGAVLQVAGAIGRVGWGLAADKVGIFRVLSALGFGGAALSLALWWQPILPVVVLVPTMIALGACATGWNGVFLSAIARSAPEGEIGAVTGAILAYTFIGAILGPSIFALTFSSVGSYPACFAIFASAGLLGGILGWKQATRT
ncbi:MFS transporter [Palleronia sp. LCG004]|uniref:MFS transporter n=1 Tax=Palleronia sp. LCG004 TaxID=3079304 RepID=UPI002941C653|nr:MFS transporter [Palleronia sp. LCG004]WOI58021.1 MFS transporter [Palleronia sp. LCG004]